MIHYLQIVGAQCGNTFAPAPLAEAFCFLIRSCNLATFAAIPPSLILGLSGVSLAERTRNRYGSMYRTTSWTVAVTP
jgi:hypothetical protein